jgi:hypothetical protein
MAEAFDHGYAERDSKCVRDRRAARGGATTDDADGRRRGARRQEDRRMSRVTTERLLSGAANLSLIAALIHAWMGPEHLEEWWGYGLFFLAAAIFQASYAAALVRRPTSSLLRIGIVVNLAFIVLWAWTRTIGIPLLGPHAGEVEPVGAIDVVSKLAEAGVVALLVIAHGSMAASHPRRREQTDFQPSEEAAALV